MLCLLLHFFMVVPSSSAFSFTHYIFNPKERFQVPITPWNCMQIFYVSVFVYLWKHDL